jgi:hypothetical protein
MVTANALMWYLVQGLARQRIAFGVGHQHLHGPVEALHQVAHARLPLRRDAHQATVGMREHVAHLLGLRQQVDGVHAEAAVHRAQQQPQGLQAVGHDDRHRVARAQALAFEHRGHAAAGAREFAVGDVAAAFRRLRVHRVRPLLRLLLDQRMDRGGRAHAHCLPCVAKKSPKISASVGTTSGIGRDTRVMFR